MILQIHLINTMTELDKMIRDYKVKLFDLILLNYQYDDDKVPIYKQKQIKHLKTMIHKLEKMRDKEIQSKALKNS